MDPENTDAQAGEAAAAEAQDAAAPEPSPSMGGHADLHVEENHEEAAADAAEGQLQTSDATQEEAGGPADGASAPPEAEPAQEPPTAEKAAEPAPATAPTDELPAPQEETSEQVLTMSNGQNLHVENASFRGSASVPASQCGWPGGNDTRDRPASAPAPELATSLLRRPHTLQMVHNSKDPLLLARVCLQERDATVKMSEQIEQRIMRARQRRNLPESKVFLNTPMSLVMKSSPGWGRRPEGWRDTWTATSHKEIGTSNFQIATAEQRNQREERLSFLQEWQQDSAHKRMMQEQAEARERELAERRARRVEKEQRVIDAARKQAEERRMALESRNKAREVAADQRVMAFRQHQQQQLAVQQQREQEKLQTAHEQATLREQAKARWISQDHALRTCRRNACAGHLTVVRAHEDKLRKSQEWDQHMRERLQQEEEKRQTHASQVLVKVAATTGKVVNNKEQQLAAMASQVQHRTTERFRLVEAHRGQLDNIKSRQDAAILRQVETRAAQRAQREAQRLAQEAAQQRQQRFLLMESYWAKEMEVEASIRNKLPDLRPDVKGSLQQFRKEASVPPSPSSTAARGQMVRVQ